MRVEVRDSKNNDRLLGTIEVRGEVRGRCYVFPLYPRMTAAWVMGDAPFSDSVEVIEMRVERVDELDKWSAKYVLTTDVPLSKLRELDSFTYPQSDYSVEVRHYGTVSGRCCSRCYESPSNKCRCKK